MNSSAARASQRSNRRVAASLVASAVLVNFCVSPLAGAQEAEPAPVPAEADQPAAQTPAPADAAEAPAPAEADPDALIAQMADVAQQVSAKSEEVKGLEDDLAAAEKEEQELHARADEAQAEADRAEADARDQQGKVDYIAKSRYRGDTRNGVSGALAAKNPAAAVERLGYLGALTRLAKKNLDTMSDAAEKARAARDEANAAAHAAAEKAKEIQEQRERVLAEQRELEEQKADIEARVDGLSGEQRAAWLNHFAGLGDVDVEGLADSSGSPAVAAALTRIGSPYGWGATGPDAFDCSGLMVWAYQQMGKTIPRTSQAQIAGGHAVPVDKLQPGDIVGYYPGVTHVAMYIGDGKVVHASTYGVPVQVVPVDSMPISGTARY